MVRRAVRAVRSGIGVAADRTEPHHRRPAPESQRRFHPRAAAHDDAARGDGAHQVVELPFDRREVVENVGVVVLQVVDDEGARPVVHELRALVEERGVVLVGFDDEVAPPPELPRSAEAGRNAADQPTGLAARAFQDPRDEARHRGPCRGCPPPRSRGGREALDGRATRGRFVVEPLVSMYSTAGLPRLKAFPTMTRSGAGRRCSARYPSRTGMRPPPASRSWAGTGRCPSPPPRAPARARCTRGGP